MKRAFWCFLVFGWCLTIQDTVAQKQFTRWKSIADAHFQVKEYHAAIPFYKKCIKTSGDRDSVVYRLALCYTYCRRNKEAQKAYQYLLQENPTLDTLHFAYAESLRKAGQYQESKRQYKIFLASSKCPHCVERLIASCDSSILWKKQPFRWRVENVAKLNTVYSELSPFVFQHRLLFASDKEETIIQKKDGFSGAPSFDLYYSEKGKDSAWKESQSFSSELNTNNHETSSILTLNGEKIYFSRALADKDNAMRIKLFSAEKKKSRWSDINGFIFNDSLSSFAQPFVDESDKIFFFVSNMPGGYGGTDIYVCVNVEGKWSNPYNLGNVINTSKNETYPFYSSTENKLYFSSDGHFGMGGQDIFVAEQKKGEWEKVTNLKYPINSPHDDFGFCKENEIRGYFSSNRDGGKGREDIYMYYRK